MPWRLLQYGDTLDALLGGLDVKAEVRVKRDLRALAVKGNQLRGPHTDSLGGGLFELRTPHNGMSYRHVFMFHEGDIVILLSFEKKTRKTPQSVLELAKERRKEVLLERASLEQATIH